MIATQDSPKPSTAATGGPLRFVAHAIEQHRLLPLVIYLLFAAAIYAVHGPEPALSIDHVSYFKLADDIRQGYSLGDYWRSINAVRLYGVMLAYLFDATGSHVASLKVLLAAMTVAYLCAFQVFMGIATDSRPRRVLFSLLSALFVTFGASIWGMTDFAASLNRTLIIPFVVLLAWFFFSRFRSPWRYAVYPAFILLGLLHLSALHVFIVFGAFELLDFILRRRARLDRDVAWFIAALVASLALQGVIENMLSGASGYVRYTLSMALPSVAQMLPPPPGPTPARPAPPPAEGEKAAAAPEAFPQPVPGTKLTSKDAWRLELLAFPWRNLPPSAATLATIASSFGVILLLAIAGALRAIRSQDERPLDRPMVTFAFGVLLAAYGLQTILWAIRGRLGIFPINFEEVRAINMIMIPAIYFVFRLYELAPGAPGMAQRAMRVAIVVAYAVQPIVALRLLPADWREGMLRTAVSKGLVKSIDAPRMLYARQFLGLAGDGRRFYYSSRPLIAWLERSTGPRDLVLSNLNELHGTRVRAVGPFLNIVSFDAWDPRRAYWAQTLNAIDAALGSRDLGRVLGVARRVGATYAIVDWPVEGAVYRDQHYSVVPVPEPTAAAK